MVTKDKVNTQLKVGGAGRAAGKVTAGRAAGQEMINMRGGAGCGLRFPARAGP